MRASPSGPSWLAVVALQATAIASRPVRDAVAAQGPKEPSSKSCVSISSSDTDEWCQTNCKVGVCPKGVCKYGNEFVTLKHTGCDLEAQGCIETPIVAFAVRVASCTKLRPKACLHRGGSLGPPFRGLPALWESSMKARESIENTQGAGAAGG